MGVCQLRMMTIASSLTNGLGKVVTLLSDAESTVGFSFGVSAQTEKDMVH